MDEAILSQSWRGIQEKGLIVVCNRDGLRRKVKILNANNDNFLSVEDSGYLNWISVNAWGEIEAEDYEKYIFSEDVSNGIMMCFDAGECIAGFLWSV